MKWNRLLEFLVFLIIERKSIFHALNQKAVARRVANELNKKYKDLNLIITHMGGGITVGAHKQGQSHRC